MRTFRGQTFFRADIFQTKTNSIIYSLYDFLKHHANKFS